MAMFGSCDAQPPTEAGNLAAVWKLASFSILHGELAAFDYVLPNLYPYEDSACGVITGGEKRK
jgi:hypothetical protein